MTQPNGGSVAPHGASQLRPPIPYFGGKITLAEQIASLLPPHKHYVEPFAGGLSVLLAKTPSQVETVNDLDQDLVTFWRVLRDTPEDLIRVASATPHSRAEYLAAYDLDGAGSDLERARRVWVILSQGRAGTLRRTGWRHQQTARGRSSAVTTDLISLTDRMGPAADRLRRVTLECRDALDVIRDYGRDPDALIYADPPYLSGTRAGAVYRHEMADKAAHRALAETLHACSAAVVLSGYHSPLYDVLYGGWHVHEIAAWTGQGSVRGERTEVLWSNRPLVTDGDLTLFAEATA